MKVTTAVLKIIIRRYNMHIVELLRNNLLVLIFMKMRNHFMIILLILLISINKKLLKSSSNMMLTRFFLFNVTIFLRVSFSAIISLFAVSIGSFPAGSSWWVFEALSKHHQQEKKIFFCHGYCYGWRHRKSCRNFTR